MRLPRSPRSSQCLNYYPLFQIHSSVRLWRARWKSRALCKSHHHHQRLPRLTPKVRGKLSWTRSRTSQASCVTEVASISQRDSSGPAGENRATADLVTRGIISNDTAQALFSVYSRLDQYLYGILGDHDNLASVRGSSALLTSAICAVGALHSASIGALGSAFEKCYQDFIDLSAACALSKRNTMDEVRGLVIGAFWLSDLSWTLVGAGTSRVYPSRILASC